jgi:hypothetical protein
MRLDPTATLWLCGVVAVIVMAVLGWLTRVDMEA